MRKTILDFVSAELGRRKVAPGRALDIGSLDVNGNARQTFESRGWKYTGLDAIPGPNVDIVGGVYDLPSVIAGLDTFDCIVCLETIEHLMNPWDAVKQMRLVLRPGGLLILTIAGNGFPEHRYPLDCWRVMPDGMAALLGGMNDPLVKVFTGDGGPGVMGSATI